MAKGVYKNKGILGNYYLRTSTAFNAEERVEKSLNKFKDAILNKK